MKAISSPTLLFVFLFEPVCVQILSKYVIKQVIIIRKYHILSLQGQQLGFRFDYRTNRMCCIYSVNQSNAQQVSKTQQSWKSSLILANILTPHVITYRQCQYQKMVVSIPIFFYLFHYSRPFQYSVQPSHVFLAMSPSLFPWKKFPPAFSHAQSMYQLFKLGI